MTYTGIELSYQCLFPPVFWDLGWTAEFKGKEAKANQTLTESNLAIQNGKQKNKKKVTYHKKFSLILEL